MKGAVAQTAPFACGLRNQWLQTRNPTGRLPAMDNPAIRESLPPAPHLAWWSATLDSFRAQTDERIVERLNLRLVEAHFTARADQVAAWRGALPVLRAALAGLPGDWRLLLEYPLLRLGRRLDVILVTDRAIFVMEFKTSPLDTTARAQAEDYALDLRDFHAGCRHHPIVPILVAAGAKPAAPTWPLFWSTYVNPLFEASASALPDLITEILARIHHRGVDIAGWEQAPYRPVPTIVEAAIMLYRKHGVAEIRTARADSGNLSRTNSVILEAIAAAKAHGGHIVVFVTGIPGAGKTLCGLDVVFSADTAASFLTGTLPMVYVLNAALANDAADGTARSKGQAERKTKGKIQSITRFLQDNRERSDPPAEHVIIFDEAQRAWDAAYGAQKFKLADSEAGIVLDIMRRHRDYAVIVGLVGTGQEINTGEAGLQEWGKALAARPDWQTLAPPDVLRAAEPRQRLFETAPPGAMFNDALHLNVPIRQIRAAAAAPWVDAVLRGAIDEAAAIARDAEAGVPFLITRSLAALRAGLRVRSAGRRRAGLVCSSGAKRLIADGLWPKFDHINDAMVANWFLKRWPDVRGSDALEIPATEFACQGLELDYVGLCWGGDFIRNGNWVVRNFSGSKWQYPKRQDAQDFCRNTYRVLLTRARYDTIIWIPPGDADDPTREPALFDQTAAFLIECGAAILEDSPQPTSSPQPQLF
jgi:hypothetical protein